MYYDLSPYCGLSGGAMVLGKLPAPGRPTNLDYSRARAYCACSRYGLGCLDIFILDFIAENRSGWKGTVANSSVVPRRPSKVMG